MPWWRAEKLEKVHIRTKVWEKASHLSDGFCCLSLALCKCLQSFLPFWTILTFLLFTYMPTLKIKIDRLRFLLTKFTLFFKRISHFQTSHFRSTVLFGLFHWTKGCLEKKHFFAQFFSAKKKFQKSHMLSNKMFKNWLLKPPSPSESWPTEEGGRTGSELFRPIHQHKATSLIQTQLVST